MWYPVCVKYSDKSLCVCAVIKWWISMDLCRLGEASIVPSAVVRSNFWVTMTSSLTYFPHLVGWNNQSSVSCVIHSVPPCQSLVRVTQELQKHWSEGMFQVKLHGAGSTGNTYIVSTQSVAHTDIQWNISHAQLVKWLRIYPTEKMALIFIY